ncbi:hypothetical protein FA95DRAFT_1548791 [Auriscalpium vulgare]|uniref:Uncharacterized protein n=1 Tax=Auriscalpium vulgare TaxID=40419 RepID=A0ACB8RCV7_9AGAM|nr:hypothetical protein FA95DRAFT_1548791 [Auriscalpium vulgare]
MLSEDDNPRPAKRQRTTSPPPPPADQPLAPLPARVLLLALPDILVQPPTHPQHVHSLYLSTTALRQCLQLSALSPEAECRAWTALAEVGMAVIDGGMSQSPEHPWASGIEQEVEKAVSKGLLLAKKHPSLRLFTYPLLLTHARLSHAQHNPKFARALLRRLLAATQPATDPPALVCSAHLALVDHFLRAQDAHNALAALGALEESALSQVALLARVVRLHTLVAHAQHADVPAALAAAERAFGLSYAEGAAASPRKDGAPPETFIAFADPVEELLALHTLVLGIAHHTHAGVAAAASPRLSHLHALLDSGALDRHSEGVLEIPMPHGPPLCVRMTHPRTLYYLAFLLSSVAKPDPVGRKPKRKVFALEGLAMFDRPGEAPGLSLPKWASIGELEEVEGRLDRMKADLLCELAGAHIMRSEFDEAEETLAQLIAHTRSTLLFPLYAPRITLHHAHLAHALGQSARSLACYRVAAALADAGGLEYVAAAARAGEAGLRIGLCGSDARERAEVAALARDAAAACAGMGGTLEAVGEVLAACLAPEILKSKQHLKRALGLATQAQANHLRALVLALVGAHYVHTAADHALVVLGTAEQLAAGLGAPPAKGAPLGPTHGNAPLRLWVGERYVELYRRAGKDARAQRQESANVLLRGAVEQIKARGGAQAGTP